MWDSRRDTDVENRLSDSVKVGWFERIALKHVCYHMWSRLPVQVRCMRQGAQGWCPGMTLRDRMGREVGRSFRMGNTCTPMADSYQCMAKTTAAAAAKSLQSCPTLCDPRDDSPSGSPLPGILQARVLEWVAISFSSKNHYCKVISLQLK